MPTIEYYEISEHSDFKKNVRRLTKKNKFFSLPDQVLELEEPLLRGEFPGTLLTHTDAPEPHDVYKLRLPNPDASAGKSNGYRIIYIVVTERRIVVLLTVYYKKEQETVSDAYISGLVDGYFLEAIPYDDKE